MRQEEEMTNATISKKLLMNFTRAHFAAIELFFCQNSTGHLLHNTNKGINSVTGGKKGTNSIAVGE